MGRRPTHPRFKRTRDTHDPQTSIPGALQEELSLPTNTDGPSSTTKTANRKSERKRKRREKRHAEHRSALEWRARRRQKHVETPTLSSEPRDRLDVSEIRNRGVSATPKRKRYTPLQQPEQSKAANFRKDAKSDSGRVLSSDDPDAREARRIEKLLGISRKKKRKTAKGGSFAYSDAFGEDGDLVDLLDFCDRTMGRAVEQSEMPDSDSDAEHDENKINIEEDADEKVEEAHEKCQPAPRNEGDEGIESDGACDGDFSPGDMNSRESSDGNMSLSEKDASISPIIPEKAMDKRNSTRVLRRYVPPGSRGTANVKTIVTRKIRGLLNRVADANASGIADSIIRIFEESDQGLSRKEITTIYANSTLDSVRDGSGVGYTNPYLQSHAAIASHIAHRVDGIVLVSLVVLAARRFDHELRSLDADSENLNEDGSRSDAFGYVALLGSLYERRTVSCHMIYDLVKTIAEPLSSERLGLLLALIRQVGSFLRLDDPTALKEMIEFIHAQADILVDCMDKTTEGEVRPKLQIMLDLINDIKNNKLKRSALQEASARYAWAGLPEYPLSASLRDLLNGSFTSTPWWGREGSASVPAIELRGGDGDGAGKIPSSMEFNHGSDPDLANLASSLRLSTGRRKDLFKVIIGSASVSEAYERLEGISAFDSKKHHDRDTAIVILRCCGLEKTFNPFYAHLAERMCNRARRFRFTFEFACWDIFKSIPGTAKTKPMSKRRMRNFGHLLAHLWHCAALSLSVLRYAEDFEECGDHEVSFYAEAIELLLAKLAQDEESNATAPFEKLLSESWDGVQTFRVSLALFLRRFVRPLLENSGNGVLSDAVRMLEGGKGD